ncbi:MAG TPA: PadR family transcriptional regulator [Acidimicrobiia bacterium]|nr:PadR family transcriptional regulator [Acidimicrobiia bacterium]
MLELAILGLLKEFPLHGYELKKRLNDSLGHLWGVSYGSLYPALARLEKAGAIEVIDPPVATATIPATGSISGEAAAARLRRRPRPSGRTRKAYRIASRGQTLFTELLSADVGPGADEDRTFALKLAFCRHLDPPARLELLERRRAHLAEKLARGRAALAELARGGRGRIADRYTRALIEHETLTAERDLEWVDSLIEQERTADHTGGPHTLGQPQGGNP